MSLVDGVTSIISILHIAAGVLAMGLLGPAAMLAHKGSEAHRRWGNTYFWVMKVLPAAAASGDRTPLTASCTRSLLGCRMLGHD